MLAFIFVHAYNPTPVRSLSFMVRHYDVAYFVRLKRKLVGLSHNISPLSLIVVPLIVYIQVVMNLTVYVISYIPVLFVTAEPVLTEGRHLFVLLSIAQT